MKPNKRGFCPNCKKMVVGLYQLKSNPKRECIRRAFFCRECKIVLKPNEIVYKKIIFELDNREL